MPYGAFNSWAIKLELKEIFFMYKFRFLRNSTFRILLHIFEQLILNLHENMEKHNFIPTLTKRRRLHNVAVFLSGCFATPPNLHIYFSSTEYIDCKKLCHTLRAGHLPQLFRQRVNGISRKKLYIFSRCRKENLLLISENVR